MVKEFEWFDLLRQVKPFVLLEAGDFEDLLVSGVETFVDAVNFFLIPKIPNFALKH